jgi:hypothetical protein
VRIPILLAALFSSGCTPFVSYQHLSDPQVSDDGYDMGCMGLKHYEGRFTAKASACHDVHRSDWLAHVELEYDLIRRK